MMLGIQKRVFDMERCPICGRGILHEKITKEDFLYKGKPISISHYLVLECDHCGECIVPALTILKSLEILRLETEVE